MMRNSLLFLCCQILFASCQEDCISTPAKFTEHLELLLSSPSSAVGTICPGTRLGTRTQVLTPGARDPVTLSKYGNFWAFATGEDVASEWLTFAKNANGDKKKFTVDVLHHVGFADNQMDFSKRFRMVVFDMSMLDTVWTENGGISSFPAVWQSTMDYLGGVFTVCHNNNAGYPDGDNISGDGDCVDRTLTVSKAAQDMIVKTPWQNITGCPVGYPGHSRMRTDYASCMSDCLDASSADLYCQYINIITPISYGGSVHCVEEYELSKPSGMTTDMEALWARVWFEKCMGCNPWFTGKGVGYDPSEGDETGSEYFVRGDVDLNKLGPASFTDIFNP